MTDCRLPDWAYNESELVELDKQLLSTTMGPYNAVPVKGMAVMLSIFSKNGNTGKIIVAESPDVVEKNYFVD